jgi:hypothetical protein
MKTTIKILPVLICIVFTLFGACKKEVNVPEETVNISLPTVTTDPVTNISTTSALCGGNVTDDGNGTITERGICFNKNGSPSLTNFVGCSTDLTGGTGNFENPVARLSPNTTYYVRAYATNSKGTSYGEERTFATLNNPITVTVTNLNTFDGDIPLVSPFPDGSWSKQVKYYSTETFKISYTETPKLYIYTCPSNAPCYQKAYMVPNDLGDCLEYNDLNGLRKIRICRVSG